MQKPTYANADDTSSCEGTRVQAFANTDVEGGSRDNRTPKSRLPWAKSTPVRWARAAAAAPEATHMKPHTRHVAIALIIALVLLLIATVVGRSQDAAYSVFSHYSGAQLYTRFCASCHGDQGHGDGRVAASFKIMVPDLTQIARRHGGTFPEEQVRKIIDGRTTLPPHGSREMPVWGFEFLAQGAGEPAPQQRTDELIARLTDYIRSLQTD